MHIALKMCINMYEAQFLFKSYFWSWYKKSLNVTIRDKKVIGNKKNSALTAKRYMDGNTLKYQKSLQS